MSKSATIYPLDCSGLSKGDYLAPSEASRILGKAVGTDAYRLGLLQLVQYIETVRERMGEPLQVRIEGDGLRILTDPEAVDWNEVTRRKHVRGMLRTYRRQVRVDRGNLSAPEMRVHERSVMVLGQSLQALQRIGRMSLTALQEQHRAKLPDLRSSRDLAEEACG